MDIVGILVEALGRELPVERLIVDPDVLASFSHDDAEWAPVGRAAICVRARSEGTLGVVTEVTLRLRPARAGTPRTVVGAFADLVASGQAVAQITRRGLTPSVLELLDRSCRALDPLEIFNPGKG